MNEQDIARRWEELRDRLQVESRAAKDSQSVVVELDQAYRRLQPAERTVVDEILSGWLASDDEALRFDAIALIRQNRIRSSVPALEQLAHELETHSAAGAPYERAKVLRTIEAL